MKIQVIPALDSNPFLIQRAQRPLGKAFLLFWFATGFWLLNFPNWLSLSVVVAMTLIFSLRPLTSLALCSVPFWISTDLVWGNPWFSKTMRILSAHEGMLISSEDMWLRALLLFVVVFLCFSIFVWQRIFPPNRVGHTLRPLVIFLVGVGILSWFQPVGSLAVVLWGMVFILAKSIWFFSYDSALPASKMPTWRRAFSMVPFWWVSGQTPTPRGISELVQIERTTPVDLAVWRLKALKLLYWCLLLRWLFVSIHYLVFKNSAPLWTFLSVPSLNLISYRQIGLESFNLLNMPVLWTWLNLLVTSLNWLGLEIAVYGGAQVALMRMVGFSALRASNKPYRAKSFNEFFARAMVYYNALLSTLFFFPFWGHLGFMKAWRRTRIFLSVFLTVFVGGLTYHFIRDVHNVLIFGFGSAFFRLFWYLSPYFFFFGLFSAASFSWQQRFPARQAEGLWHWVRLSVIFAVYSVLLVNSTSISYSESWSDRLRFLARLSGF